MRLLVIGGVAAGLSAAARARRIDPGLEILVLEKGGVVSYGACGLPYYLEGRVRRARQLIVYTPEYFRTERNVEVRTHARVASIAHALREVVLDETHSGHGGERLHYDRLVIATGARPNTPDLAGASLPHIFTLHTLDDAERLKAYLREKQPRKATVAGAGYIGLEAADALRRNGLRVTVVEQGSHVLGRASAELTDAVRTRCERFQVELQLGTRMTDAAGCELVVLATGLRPNVEIAADAGVAVGQTGAIRVDDHMETNLPGVYAAGDCAEALHRITGRPAYIPLGTTANKMGRVAGANAAGRRERFGGVVGTAIVSIFGLGVGLSGLSAEQARHEGFAPVSVHVTAASRPGYFGGRPLTVELVADKPTGRLLGGAVWGEQGVEGRINVIAAALHNRMRVEDLEQLDLAYAPPFATVWDPVLIAAQQLSKMV